MKRILLPPVAWLLIVMVMGGLYAICPANPWLPQPYNWLGIAFVVAGWAIASWHARLFRKLGTNINTFGEPGTLTHEGLFRRSRNPMYLGMLTALIGVALVMGTACVLIGPVVFFALAQCWYIPAEERALAGKFGEEYLGYRKDVPRWFGVGRR